MDRHAHQATDHQEQVGDPCRGGGARPRRRPRLGLGGGTQVRQSSQPTPPTVVLVHGAWADSSSWGDVVGRLQGDGYPVVALANPLRGLAADSAYLAAYLHSIPGPIVLVGHSYGGAVITNAATDNPNVKALVYVDAFAPDEGEASCSWPPHSPARPWRWPTRARSSPSSPTPVRSPATSRLTVLSSVFRTAFANDLSRSDAAVQAATQRPVALFALSEPSGVPAWKTIPSWYVAGSLDGVLPIAEQRAMATRAGSHLVTLRPAISRWFPSPRPSSASSSTPPVRLGLGGRPWI